MDKKVDAYISRSKQWPDEMRVLRTLLLGAGLDEAIKWGKPCYSHEGANIAIMQEMKNFLALMFFKGALLDDPQGLLQSQGENSRSALRLCFTSAADVERLAGPIADFVDQAVAAEAAGLEVAPAPELRLAAELQARLDRDAKLRAAFEALTPGRRREYNLHISDAKQAKTREARVDKCAPRILAGKGLRDGDVR